MEIRPAPSPDRAMGLAVNLGPWTGFEDAARCRRDRRAPRPRSGRCGRRGVWDNGHGGAPSAIAPLPEPRPSPPSGQNHPANPVRLDLSNPIIPPPLMQTEAFTELFPLFNAASQETLEWLLSVAVSHEYPAGRAVLMEDSWGNAVYFIASGWVKVRRLSGDKDFTLAILGTGDFFGEMAILDESPRSTDVVALSSVQLISISAQRFIQTLFKDAQLHHRLLQLMVRRVRGANIRLQLRRKAPAIKLANTLVSLADQYGQPAEQGRDIFNITHQDLADVSDITVDEAAKIMEKLQEKGWLAMDEGQQLLHLTGLKQLSHLAVQG